MKNLLILIPFLFTIQLSAQSKLVIRDINAKGYFQIENIDNLSAEDWINLTKNPSKIFDYFDVNSSDTYYFNTSAQGNSTIALNLSLVNTKYLEEIPKLTPSWQFSFMLARENLDNYYNQDVTENNIYFTNSLNVFLQRNVVRAEAMRLWRTDDTKKAFVSFGFGLQMGYAYNSDLFVTETSYSNSNSGFYNYLSNSSTTEAKSSMSTYAYFPVDTNVKIIENLFFQLELRTGLKHVMFFDGPTSVYPTYGIGVGARYIL